uniref:Ankyrin repeat protein n=1 Tax=Panagrolaimus superbus TaxID=310955 RepID=A0A914Z8V0_9BILA
MAVMEEKYEIVSFLIKSGASLDISTTDKLSKVPSKRTPLMEAVSLGSSALIRLLISNGANPFLKDAEYKKASFYFDEEEFEKNFAVAEFDDLKEAMELLKNAETEREVREGENDQQDDDVEESNLRKRLNEGTLNVSKRTRRK